LGQRFDDAEWQVMVDLGYLVDALRSTCCSACWYKHSDDPNDRPRLEMEVKVRNQQVRDAYFHHARSRFADRAWRESSRPPIPITSACSSSA
jgi:hypothetical protein